MERSPGDCKSTPAAEETQKLAQAMMAFTTDLFSLVSQTSTSSNLVLSPLSVALALSHLALGTEAAPVQKPEATKGSVLQTLPVGGSSIRDTWTFGRMQVPELSKTQG